MGGRTQRLWTRGPSAATRNWLGDRVLRLGRDKGRALRLLLLLKKKAFGKVPNINISK